MAATPPPEVYDHQKKLEQFFSDLGFQIDDIKNSELFLTAFIHKSYAADFKTITSHNERLEFVGDGILWAIVAKLLFSKFPQMEESEMTLYKIALVREETLARVWKSIGLDKMIFISKGEENAQGRDKDTILWDAVEALLGYLYVDIGEVAAQQFVEKYIFSLLPLINKTPIKSYKTMVQEYIQKDLKITPEYQEQEFEKDQKGNILQYTSSLFIQGEKKSEGKGTNKKKAQEAAAKNFYESLEETIS